MTAGSESRRAIVGAMVGLSYGAILGFLSLAAAGSGHGTLMPLLLSSAPLSVFYLVADTDAGRQGVLFLMLFGGPFVWAALGSLVSLSSRGTILRLTQVLVLLHYASGLAVVATTGVGFTGLAGKVPDGFILWGPVYLAGQVALWWQMSRRNQLD